MNYEECIELARPRIGKYCKACKECNGKACGNQIPGPGAKGIGDTAIRNYDKWKEIRVNMDTIAENGPVNTSLELFGKKFRYPFLRVRWERSICIMEIALMTFLIMIFWFLPAQNLELRHSPEMEWTAM